jgi:hypothetical protein
MKKEKIHLLFQIILFAGWALSAIGGLLFFIYPMIIGGVQIVHSIVLSIVAKNARVLRLLRIYFIGLLSFLVVVFLSMYVNFLIVILIFLAIYLTIHFLYTTYVYSQEGNEAIDDLSDFLQADAPNE